MADSFVLPDLQATTNAQKTARAGLLSGINTSNNDFINKISSTIAGQPTTAQLADTIGGQLNLPQLRQTALNANQAVFNTPYRNLAATRGADVTQNQLDRINSYDLQKLGPVAALTAQNQQAAEGTLATRMGYEQADQAKALLPYQYQAPLVSQSNQLAAAGFDTDAGNELQGLIAKMNAGVTLNEGELNRANSLALAKEDAQNKMELAKYNNSSQGNDYLSVGEGNAVFDPTTGQVLYKNPKTYQASGGGTSNPAQSNTVTIGGRTYSVVP